jgi:hypothetical protein
MLRTYLYIPDNLEKQINQAVEIQKTSKAEVMRQALRKGIKIMTPKTSGADILLKIAEIGRKYKLKGPKDLSVNHDYYLWGGAKRSKI